MTEGIFRREILPWGLIGFTLGLVEGATAAVLVKQHFAGVAPRFAIVTSRPSSAAMMPARCATSLECCRMFWP